MLPFSFVLSVCAGVTIALPTRRNDVTNTSSTPSFWKGTPIDGLVEQLQNECHQQPDSTACLKMKALNFVDELLGKDIFKSDDDTVMIVPNENDAKEQDSARSTDASFLDHLESYIRRHDMIVKIPAGQLMEVATLKFSPRNSDNNEFNFSVKLQQPPEEENSVVEERGNRRRKSKLRKIMLPIIVFVLLKAMTLIPLAIGVLGLKAWNALQLSFISFLVSISLAIFQLCKKVAHDSSPPITAHIPFDGGHYAAARNFIIPSSEANAVIDSVNSKSDVNAQNLAYAAYTNTNLS